MSDTGSRLMSALKEGPKNIEVLIAATALTAAEVLSTLTMLELQHVVRRLPRMVFKPVDNATPDLVVPVKAGAGR